MQTHIQIAPGFKVSRIINGLWQIADMERGGASLKQDHLEADIQKYIANGMTTFDMADHYGSSEVIMGTFQKNHPKIGLQLLTKWVPKPGKSDKNSIRKAVERSLRRLQSDSIDLLQYHAWNYADPIWIDHLIWLNDLRKEGLIKHIGLTNTDAVHLKMILDSGIPIATNQISYSLIDRRAQNQMESICSQYGVHILAFGTLAGGFLTDKWIGKSEPDIEKLSTWSQMKYKRYLDEIGDWDTFQKVLIALKDLADSHHLSLANLATAYILNRPNVSSVIIGARLGESQHIADNLKILSGELPRNIWKKVDQILVLLNPLPGHCGDEYRKPPYLTAAGDLSHHLDAMPVPYSMKKVNEHKSVVHSGTPWESIAGYCRAFKSGNRILVSGTTATHGHLLIGGKDPASQTHFIIDKIEGALQSLGAQLSDVIRTRIYIRNISDWEPVSRAHGHRFSARPPANTLVRADLIGDEYLVEIEAEAEIH